MWIRIGHRIRIERRHVDPLHQQVSPVFGVSLSRCRVDAEYLVADDMVRPIDLALDGLFGHVNDLFVFEETRELLLAGIDDVAEKRHVSEFVFIDIFDDIGSARHEVTGCQEIEEHEPVVEIEPFEEVVTDNDLFEVLFAGIISKILESGRYEPVPVEQYLVDAPVVVDSVLHLFRDDGVDDVAVALTVYRFLVGLQTEDDVYLRGRDVVRYERYVICLDTIEENQE